MPRSEKMSPLSMLRVAAYMRHIATGMPDNDERKWKLKQATAYEDAAILEDPSIGLDVLERRHSEALTDGREDDARRMLNQIHDWHERANPTP